MRLIFDNIAEPGKLNRKYLYMSKTFLVVMQNERTNALALYGGKPLDWLLNKLERY